MTRWLKVQTLREARFSVLRAGLVHAFPSVFPLSSPSLTWRPYLP